MATEHKVVTSLVVHVSSFSPSIQRVVRTFRELAERITAEVTMSMSQ